jgi:hypothetical protein
MPQDTNFFYVSLLPNQDVKNSSMFAGIFNDRASKECARKREEAFFMSANWSYGGRHESDNVRLPRLLKTHE